MNFVIIYDFFNDFLECVVGVLNVKAFHFNGDVVDTGDGRAEGFDEAVECKLVLLVFVGNISLLVGEHDVQFGKSDLLYK